MFHIYGGQLDYLDYHIHVCRGRVGGGTVLRSSQSLNAGFNSQSPSGEIRYNVKFRQKASE